MKSDELVRRINNGEIKDGAKIKCIFKGRQLEVVRLCGDTLQFENGDYPKANMFLIPNAEFEIVEEHKGWFKPKMGELYWVVTLFGNIYSFIWNGNKVDLYCYENHNCFRTQEDAQKCDEYRDALKEAEKPFEIKRDNYFIRLNSDGDDLFLDRHFLCQYQGITYLGQDETVAQAFIDKWKPQILKYEFDVWE